MVRIFVKYKVHDDAAWRQVFNAYESTRIKLGLRGQASCNDGDDGKEVTAWHDFANLDAAKTFVSSSELKAAMKRAGVDGAPTIWFTHA
jgi:hypothetical protein